MIKTPWFPGTVNPVHVGWHERQHYNLRAPVWSWWDGSLWRHRNMGIACDVQNIPWRGLTKEAK